MRRRVKKRLDYLEPKPKPCGTRLNAIYKNLLEISLLLSEIKDRNPEALEQALTMTDRLLDWENEFLPAAIIWDKKRRCK